MMGDRFPLSLPSCYRKGIPDMRSRDSDGEGERDNRTSKVNRR